VINLERKTLNDYLSQRNFELLDMFKMGIQGQNDFGQFMNLVREQQQEIDALREDAELLSCLEACGVDNWSGYSDAIQMFREEEE
jgi:maleate cis-trans isomerase